MVKEGAMSILMLPWLAHGHISPFLELAKKLSYRNFVIYFCSTPINLSYISKVLGDSQWMGIELVELHLPPSPDLPPHHHTTKGLPPHLLPVLINNFNSANSDFYNILKSLRPDLLIYDLFQQWVPALASSLGIPAVEFLVSGACMASFHHHFGVSPQSEYPFGEIYLTHYQRDKFAKLADHAVLECMRRSVKIMMIKSFREFESKYLDHLCTTIGKKLVPIGPLIQEPVGEEIEDETSYMRWLDTKDPMSTVFISFGSECYLSKENMGEIAKGLELSHVNFIWGIRFPKGEIKHAKEELPIGFLDRIGEKGFVVEEWAPQMKILAHPSIGGFLSHCGWSSVMESMSLGVPIIAMPMQFDQPINARLVAATGVGIVVERDDEGKFSGDEIAKVISKVVLEKVGERLRGKAKELSGIMRHKGDEEIDELARELTQLCRGK